MDAQALSTFFKTYLGAKYTWWHEGEPVGYEAPFYSREAYNYPSVEEVKEKGVCCAGLINIGRSVFGLEGLRGTYQMEPLFEWKVLKEDTHICEGTVLFRKYADDEDQGHIGYVISDTEFIHSCDYDEVETGVVISPTHPWRHYFTHWISFEEMFVK